MSYKDYSSETRMLMIPAGFYYSHYDFDGKTADESTTFTIVFKKGE